MPSGDLPIKFTAYESDMLRATNAVDRGLDGNAQAFGEIAKKAEAVTTSLVASIKTANQLDVAGKRVADSFAKVKVAPQRLESLMPKVQRIEKSLPYEARPQFAQRLEAENLARFTKVGRRTVLTREGRQAFEARQAELRAQLEADPQHMGKMLSSLRRNVESNPRFAKQSAKLAQEMGVMVKDDVDQLVIRRLAREHIQQVRMAAGTARADAQVLKLSEDIAAARRKRLAEENKATRIALQANTAEARAAAVRRDVVEAAGTGMFGKRFGELPMHKLVPAIDRKLGELTRMGVDVNNAAAVRRQIEADSFAGRQRGALVGMDRNRQETLYTHVGRLMYGTRLDELPRDRIEPRIRTKIGQLAGDGRIDLAGDIADVSRRLQAQFAGEAAGAIARGAMTNTQTRIRETNERQQRPPTDWRGIAGGAWAIGSGAIQAAGGAALAGEGYLNTLRSERKTFGDALVASEKSFRPLLSLGDNVEKQTVVRDKALALSTSAGIGDAQAAELMFNLQSGSGNLDQKTRDDILKATRAIHSIGGDDPGEIMNSIIKPVQIYGPKAGSVDRIASMLFRTNEEGMMTQRDVSLYTPELLSAGAAAGLEMEEVLGSFTTASIKGGSNQQTRTGLRNLIAQLPKLKESGVIRGDTKTLVDALGQLAAQPQEKIAELVGMDSAATTTNLIASRGLVAQQTEGMRRVTGQELNQKRRALLRDPVNLQSRLLGTIQQSKQNLPAMMANSGLGAKFTAQAIEQEMVEIGYALRDPRFRAATPLSELAKTVDWDNLRKEGAAAVMNSITDESDPEDRLKRRAASLAAGNFDINIKPEWGLDDSWQLENRRTRKSDASDIQGFLEEAAKPGMDDLRADEFIGLKNARFMGWKKDEAKILADIKKRSDAANRQKQLASLAPSRTDPITDMASKGLVERIIPHGAGPDRPIRTVMTDDQFAAYQARNPTEFALPQPQINPAAAENDRFAEVVKSAAGGTRLGIEINNSLTEFNKRRARIDASPSGLAKELDQQRLAQEEAEFKTSLQNGEVPQALQQKMQSPDSNDSRLDRLRWLKANGPKMSDLPQRNAADPRQTEITALEKSLLRDVGIEKEDGPLGNAFQKRYSAKQKKRLEEIYGPPIMELDSKLPSSPPTAGTSLYGSHRDSGHASFGSDANGELITALKTLTEAIQEQNRKAEKVVVDPRTNQPPPPPTLSQPSSWSPQF
jgi:hypothetical protein